MSEKMTKNGLKRAFIFDENKIKIHLLNSSSLDFESLEIFEGAKQLEKVAITQYDGELILEFDKKLNLDKPHRINNGSNKIYSTFSLEMLNKYFYYKGKLGAHVLDSGELELNLWSPTAESVTVHIYDNSRKELFTEKLKRGNQGVWKALLEKQSFSWHSLYYEYEVNALGKTRFGVDPYAMSLSSHDKFNKKERLLGAIIDLHELKQFDEKSFKKNSDIISNPLEFVASEIHIRDITIDPSSGVEEHLRGTYLGAAQKVDWYKKMGFSHVQVMPVQAIITVDESQKTFQDESVEKSLVNYNWGYDPQHYYALSGWFSLDADRPALRMNEFKRMVQAFHEKSIGVVIDVVYNHVLREESFDDVAPGCYYRIAWSGSNSYHTGAGVTMETRNLMFRRLVIDSLRHFADFYHVNGFRFDLMGFMDHETMREIRKELGDDIILYGEGWDFTDLPLNEATTKNNLPGGIGLGVFNDTSRDAYTGAMHGKGFVQGWYGEASKAKAGIIGSIKNYPRDYDNDGNIDVWMSGDPYHLFAESPSNTMNYLTIHDGYTLWDKLNISVGGAREIRTQMMKQSLAMLMTSQGRVVLHGGVEIARSKPLAENDWETGRAHSSPVAMPEYGKVFFHENSYRSPDITNRIDWSRSDEFSGLTDYVAGLVKLRSSLPGLRYEKADSIRQGLRFFGERKDLLTPFQGKFKSFKELEKLTIKFINGPIGGILYLTGEVFPLSSQNPKHNPYRMVFDEDGKFEVSFNREQISKFNLVSWSDPDALQVKLVYRSGEWDAPESSYSPLGNNTIRPERLDSNGEAVIDLSIMDHNAGERPNVDSPFIAYTLDNHIEDKTSPYKKIIVIHSASPEEIYVALDEKIDLSKSKLLLDGENASLAGIENSSVKLEEMGVYIPSRSSVIIGIE